MVSFMANNADWVEMGKLQVELFILLHCCFVIASRSWMHPSSLTLCISDVYFDLS